MNLFRFPIVFNFLCLIHHYSEIKCKFEKDFCNYKWNPTEETRFVTKSSTKRCPEGCLIISPSKSSEVRSPVQTYKGDSCLAIKYRIGGSSELDIYLDVFDPSKNKKYNVWHSFGSAKSLDFNWIIKDINVDFVFIQLILTVTSKGDSVELFVSDIWFDSKTCQESLRNCNYNNSCIFHPNVNTDWKDASQGVTFGNERIIISEKNHFANQGWLRSSSSRDTIRSSLMYLNGKGCLSFNFYARGFLPNGIMLTKLNAYDGNKDTIWESDYKKQFGNPLVQIEIESKGYFTLEFSILKDLFVKYEIEDFKVNSGHCNINSPAVMRKLHQH